MTHAKTLPRLLAVFAAVLFAAGLAMSAQKEEAPKPDRPFDGKTLEGWEVKKHGKAKSQWVVGSAKLDEKDPKKFVVSKDGCEMVNAKGHGVDIYSEYVHGDAVIKIEVMVPKGSNSGIYVMGEYEIQVLDSYGRDKNPSKGDMGAIYGAAPPKDPKYKKPGEWSTFEIHFQAPRFGKDGKRAAKAKFIKVILNGGVIHENVEMNGPTPGGVDRKEKPMGPILFQGNHGAVSYRNIEVYPVKK